MSDPITLNINGRALQLSDREMLELRSMAQTPGWNVLKRVVEAMAGGSTDDLWDPGSDIEHIRWLQGRLGVVKDLRELVDEGVERWYEAMKKEQS